MTATPTWLQEALDAVTAGQHLILTVNTTDWIQGSDRPPLRLRQALAVELLARGFIPLGLTPATGVTPLGPDGGSAAEVLGDLPAGLDMEQVLPGLSAVLRSEAGPVALLVDYADHLVPTDGGMAVTDRTHQIALELFHTWSLDAGIRLAGSVLILISHTNQVHELLRSGGSGFRVVPIRLPDFEQRLHFTQWLESRRDGGDDTLGTLVEDLDVEAVARYSGGLRLDDLARLYREAAVLGRSVDEAAIRMMKQQTIAELGQGLLEVHEPTYGLDEVAGLAHLRDYFHWCVLAGRLPATGVLLCGVPGTGKSFAVKAIAHALGLPLLSLRNLHERWVGQSERNLELVLWIAENLAPCVIWLDEIDQLLAQRSTGGSADGGTTERMMSRLWEFMGETSAGRSIVWIGTTNRPDLLDAAVQDRFLVRIPFIHPGATDLAAMLPVLAAQLGRELTFDLMADEVRSVPALELTTARALLEILSVAATWTDADAGTAGGAIDRPHFDAALTDFRSSLDAELHELIALTALDLTSFSSLLPWRIRAGARADVDLPPYVGGLIDHEGKLMADGLRSRINWLRDATTARRLQGSW